ncbi:MAG: hypothetical protein WA738_14290 [Candidatus Angelobacter sp.]
MNKPAGVIVIAILYFLGAAILLLAGIGFVVGGGAIAAMMSQQGQTGGSGLATLMGALGAGVGIFFLLWGAIDVLVGVSLLKLKNWARVVAIVFAAIGACFQVFGLIGTLSHFNIGSFVITLIVLGIQVLVIWYLMKPEVKAAFQGVQVRGASA